MVPKLHPNYAPAQVLSSALRSSNLIIPDHSASIYKAVPPSLCTDPFGDFSFGRRVHQGFEARRQSPIKPMTLSTFKTWINRQTASLNDEERNAAQGLLVSPVTVHSLARLSKIQRAAVDFPKSLIKNLTKHDLEDQMGKPNAIWGSNFDSSKSNPLAQRLLDAKEQNRPTHVFIGSGRQPLEVFNASQKMPEAFVVGIDPDGGLNQFESTRYNTLTIPRYLATWGRGRVFLSQDWASTALDSQEFDNSIDHIWYIAPNGNHNPRTGFRWFGKDEINVIKSEKAAQDFYNLLKPGGQITMVTEFSEEFLKSSLQFLRRVFGQNSVKITELDFQDRDALKRSQVLTSPQFVVTSSYGRECISESALWRIDVTKYV